MVRPANARVWNEDLVAALNARADFARQQGKQRHHLWSEGAMKIQAVRQDIYAFKTGRIVGLPETKLKKTVVELCRRIIQGAEPVLPAGYTPPNFAKAGASGNNNSNNSPSAIMTQDHYLNHIKIRGGAFAILMAFYTRGYPLLTQDQVCEYAQPFCNEPMQANYLQGRSHGGWSGNKTLQSHQLLLQQKPQVQYTTLRGGGGGFRSALGARATYSLTEKGKLFVTTLLVHRPEAKQELFNYGGTGPQLLGGAVGGDMGGFAAVAGGAYGGTFGGSAVLGHVPSLSIASTSRGSISNGDDEAELREWARTAAIGSSKIFNVSKAKRITLHNACDLLSNTVLRAQGRRIHHSSQGAGRSRTLVLSMERVGAGNIGGIPEFELSGGGRLFDEYNDQFLGPAHARPLTTSHGTPPKRARTANEAAAEAAMLRAAMHESAMMAKQQQPAAAGRTMAPKQLYADAKSSTGRNNARPSKATSSNKPSRLSATASRAAEASVPTAPIVLDNSDDDSDVEDDAWLYELTIKPRRKTTKQTPSTILTLSDSSDDEDNDDENSMNMKPAARSKAPAVAKASVSPKGDDEVIDLSDEFILPVVNAATLRDNRPQPTLTIFIDDRERNKNATPRQLRMELTRIMSNGLFRRVWPSTLPAASVVERQLARGDFAFQSTIGNVSYAVPVAIERKTVADIVQRSINQDHWKQLCQMRDGFDLCCFLLEGDMRAAARHTAYGAQDQDESFSPTSHKVDDAESLVRFIGRALLSTPSFRLIQTEHEQGSLRTIAAFGLMSLYHYFLADTQLSTAVKKLQSQATAKQELKNRLQTGGVPWQMAKCISDEIGSVAEMNRLLASAEDDECRDGLLAPVIQDVCRQLAPLHGSAEQWSKAVHRAFFSPLSDVDVGRKAFEDYRDIVADHASLLVNIHSDMSAPDALDATLTQYATAKEEATITRSVHIELPGLLEDCFPQPEDGQLSIWKVDVLKSNDAVPKATMITRAGRFRSARLCMFLLDGEAIISLIADELANRLLPYVDLAKAVALHLHHDCTTDKHDHRVLLIRGLPNALSQAGKKAGYRSELPVLVDMVLAQLALAHEMVVLQAVRLKEERELIVQQLAMACYHFAPLLYKEAS